MKGIKVRIGVTAVIVSVTMLSIFNINKDMKDITPMEKVEETLSIMKTKDNMFSMVEKRDEVISNNEVTDETREATIVEEDIITTEENRSELKTRHEEDRRVSNTSRGGHLKDNKLVEENLDKHLNKYVLDVIKTYSLEDGKYPYLLNNDYENYNGVTEDLYYKGEILLKANPNGDKSNHCTGITYEVFFKAMQERNKSLGIPIDDFNGMSKEELMDFVLTWYVAKGPKSENNLSLAIEKYGLGTKITNLEDLHPGDFIDFSRENNTGHTVVFQNWIRKGEKIIGLKYWSSQGSTNGISYKEEYFNVKDENGKKYGNIIIDQLYMARISPVNKYKKY